MKLIADELGGGGFPRPRFSEYEDIGRGVTLE